MTPWVKVLGLALGLAPAAPVAFGQSAEWKTMEHVDLSRPGPLSWAAKEIWADVVAKENAYLRDTLKRAVPAGGASLRLSYASFEMDGAKYFISVALSLDCEAGGNHNALSSEPSFCPLRISKNAGDGWRTIVSDRGCYVDSSEASGPVSNQMDGAQVRMDLSQRNIMMRANVGGQWVGTCSRTFALPR